MCNFVSGLFFENGDIVEASEYTNSHEVLKRASGIRRASLAVGMADMEPVCWEYTPPDDLKLVGDLSKWTLKVDGRSAPWWDAEKVRAYCERRVEAMIIREPRGTILGGCWIVIGKNATIGELVGGKLAIAVDSRFEDSRFVGSSFVDSRFVGSSFVRSHFVDSRFVDSRFVGSSFVGSSFVGSSFVDSHFVDSHFVDSRFVDSRFVGSFGDHCSRFPVKWIRSKSGLIIPEPEDGKASGT